MKNFDPVFQGELSGSYTLNASSSISASYALTASYALNGGGGGSYTLTAGAISGLGVGIVSSSNQILPIATSSVTNFDNEVSRSAAGFGFGSGGGGGSYTLTAGAISDLGAEILSASSGDLIFSGSMNVSGSVTADEFITGESAIGSPTITAATNLNLSASNAVVVQGAFFRLSQLDNSDTGSFVAQDGDMFYNTDRKKFMGYSGSAWHEISLS